MRTNNIFEEIKSLCHTEDIFTEESMSKHTTFRVGGPADYFLLPRSVEELQGILSFCRENEIPFFILGNGSNLLVGDRGFRGVVIQIYKNWNTIRQEENRIVAGAGALLSQVARKALDAGLTGFEFASGIPGTIGGACVMNAGAYGSEMKNVLKNVTVLTIDGTVEKVDASRLELGYRTSAILKNQYIVLEAEIELVPGDPKEISDRMEELKEQRVLKQPLEFPSAGSTFKRPEGYFAGKLIQDAGLRGYCVGGAQVSEKHCGFVINREKATAADIIRLIQDVQEQVYESSGVKLETEVKFLGEF